MHKTPPEADWEPPALKYASPPSGNPTQSLIGRGWNTVRHNLRWTIVGLLTLVTVINYLDRQALAVAQVALRDDLGITPEDYGRIVSAFLIAYGVFHPLAGRVIDRLGSRLGLMLAFIWWSVASIGHAFATGVRSFATMRFLLGVGEAGNFPAAIKMVGEWFPAKERALATGILNVGTGVGAMLAPPLVGAIIYYFNWQVAFIVTGAIGFIWLIPWLILGKRPEKHPFITPEELAYIRAGQQEAASEDSPAQGSFCPQCGQSLQEGPSQPCTRCGLDPASRQAELAPAARPVAAHAEESSRGIWREALAKRELWALMAARLLSDPVWLFFTFWIPMYFKEARGFDLKSVAMFTWLPFLAADFGSIAGGWLSSFFIGRGWPVLTARKLAVCCSAAMMPLTILSVYVESWQIAIVCISIGALGHQSWSASLLTLPTDVFPKRMVASTYGFAAMMGVLGGAFSQYFVGTVIESVGYTLVFTIAGCLHPLGALMVVLFVRKSWQAEPAGGAFPVAQPAGGPNGPGSRAE
ncbi:MAG TPA: MFS transporter [Phycisphaerae bacterium]|jgi:ACS family hexuronate transporter-like MFS transporter|nr:MFS transporter [Phycisphaerae bacterium]HOB73701.1 MFS transporter [Phycisphaerae bacterium]HOJ53425.1 MFS transporter [Phycisphaerae bacterium]HOL25451.1 MFS transporter [Phycisphaerae bacterium]HPP19872.1 MFS transporter [Phycisphaerae bacterium]